MYSQSYKRYVTFFLLMVYVVNQADRNIFGFLMEPIRREIGLTDSELGFLAGPALWLLYAMLGIPVARFADRSHRLNIMSVAILAWSCIVISTSMVVHFGQLALARIGVGIGEAGFSAIAISVIADYHPAVERGRALSIFMLGLPLGSVVSSLVVGWVNQAYGWRTAFIVVGLPGVLLALLMKGTVQEPLHRQVTSVRSEDPHSSLGSVFATLWRRRGLRHLVIGQAIANILCASVVIWIPTFFMRTHGMATGELGTWLALINAIGGGAGIWLGGYATNRFGARDTRSQVRLLAKASALCVPLLVLVLWFPLRQMALLSLVPLYVLMFFFYAPVTSLVQSMSAPHIRATMASIIVLSQALTGGVVSVQVVGILSDFFTSVVGDGALGLRWSMTLTSLSVLWAAVHFWVSGRFIQLDVLQASHDGEVAVDSTTDRSMLNSLSGDEIEAQRGRAR